MTAIEDKLQRAKTALEKLLAELATELDLHYEDGDFFALTPSIEVMKDANAVLVELGGRAAPAVDHVFARYNKSRN